MLIKGHVKQKCRRLAEDKVNNQVNLEWINKSKDEQRCDYCCVKGHFIAECRIKKSGSPQGDYNKAKTKGNDMLVARIDAGFLATASHRNRSSSIRVDEDEEVVATAINHCIGIFYLIRIYRYSKQGGIPVPIKYKDYTIVIR